MTTDQEKALSDIPRCDYEGSRYQADFWTKARSYEDRAERIALQKLLPPQGRRLVEIGAGAGRLGDLYRGYDEVYLVDYAQSQLQQARERWGNDPRFTFVQGDIYGLPFPDSAFDTVVTVRVLHHIKDLGRAFDEIARITAPRGHYITEFANKRNLKAVARYLLRRGKPGENPFTQEPFEFVPLNIDYHPATVSHALEGAGFVRLDERAASFFRVAGLKERLPSSLLAGVDGLLQKGAAPLRLTPSIFIKSYRPRGPEPATDARWRCPTCHTCNFMSTEDALLCEGCGARYPIRNGIYLFRSDSE